MKKQSQVEKKEDEQFQVNRFSYLTILIVILGVILFVAYSDKIEGPFSQMVNWVKDKPFQSSLLIIFLCICLTLLFVPVILYALPIGYAYTTAFSHNFCIKFVNF